MKIPYVLNFICPLILLYVPLMQNFKKMHGCKAAAAGTKLGKIAHLPRPTTGTSLLLLSYKSYTLFQSLVHLLTLWQKLYFQLKNPVLLHTLLNTFCGSVEFSLEKVKIEIIRCSVRYFIQSIQTNSRPRSTICLY